MIADNSKEINIIDVEESELEIVLSEETSLMQNKCIDVEAEEIGANKQQDSMDALLYAFESMKGSPYMTMIKNMVGRGYD